MITFLFVFGLIGLVLTGACVFFGTVGLTLKFVCYVLGLVFSWKVLAWFFVFWLIFTIAVAPKNDKKDTK